MDWMADPVLRSAVAAGRVSAVAGESQRELQRLALEDPELFPARPFDATLFSTISACNAVSGAGQSAGELSMVNRSALWAFVVDWQIDYVAQTDAEVDVIVDRCLAVARGDAAADGLTRFLADLRDRVTAAPAVAGPGGDALVEAWCEELGRALGAMRRERSWRASHHLPSLDEYLDNADNLCSAFVNIGHWIVTTPDALAAHVPDVVAAVRCGQRVIRLLNDVATYERDVASGDLNALLLHGEPGGPEIRSEVNARVGALVADTQAAVAPLEGSAARLGEFVLRQIGFCAGFYGITDFWRF